VDVGGGGTLRLDLCMASPDPAVTRWSPTLKLAEGSRRVAALGTQDKSRPKGASARGPGFLGA